MDWDWTILSCEIEDLPFFTGSSRQRSRFFDITSSSSQDLHEETTTSASENSSQESDSSTRVGVGACCSSSTKWKQDPVNLISLPFQNLQVESKSQFQSGGMKTTTVKNPFPIFVPFGSKKQNQENNIQKSYYDESSFLLVKNGFGVVKKSPLTTLTTTKGTEKNEEKKKIPTFFMSPRSPDPFMGTEVIYFVHRQFGQPLPPLESFSAAVIHPEAGSFIQYRKLGRDTSNSSLNRYFFSFVPRFPGEHVIILKFLFESGQDVEIVEVAGGPQKVLVSRNYPLVKRGSFNHIRLGFEFNQNGHWMKKGWGVAIHHGTNNVYLADRDSDQIIVVDSSGGIINHFGEYGHNAGQFWRPTGICVDEVNGRVIITDKDHHRLSIFSLNGDYIFSFGSGGHQDGQFNYPWGVDVSKDGELIAVADSRNHRVQMFDKNGTFLRKFSIFETRPFDFKDEFYYPRGICFDNSDENLYVTDFNIHAVFKLDVGLTSKSTIIQDVDHLHRPQGISMDPAGNLLICETNSNSIRIHKSDGSFICSLEGSGRDLFESPMDISVFKDGKIAVVDESGRFRVF